jgi:hypothetical protein
MAGGPSGFGPSFPFFLRTRPIVAIQSLFLCQRTPRSP